jgi:hypothetical protein
MLDLCTYCGESQADPEVERVGLLVCRSCGKRRTFRRLPLLLVGGPAGAGKSTVGAALLGTLTEVVIMDSDLLWRREFDTPGDHYHEYIRLWLRLCANMAQAGRPVALFGAGFAVPHNFDATPERAFFSALHFLALVCDDDVLGARLRRRPAWRDTHEELIAEHLKFNHWLRENAATAAPPVTLIDTTGRPVAETAAQVAAWVRAHAQHTL